MEKKTGFNLCPGFEGKSVECPIFSDECLTKYENCILLLILQSIQIAWM